MAEHSSIGSPESMNHIGAEPVVETAIAELRRTVRTAWLQGVPNFREHYDAALFKALGIDHFQDLYKEASKGISLRHQVESRGQNLEDPLTEALLKLRDAANDSDDACLGTLSTTFVRDICNEALAQ